MKALTRLTSGLMVVLGIAIVVRTIGAGGGPAALGVVLGAQRLGACARHQGSRSRSA